ncbi:hypothetical protein H0H92_010051, partial [Tricholoma furcatifolium]
KTQMTSTTCYTLSQFPSLELSRILVPQRNTVPSYLPPLHYDYDIDIPASGLAIEQKPMHSPTDTLLRKENVMDDGFPLLEPAQVMFSGESPTDLRASPPSYKLVQRKGYYTSTPSPRTMHLPISPSSPFTQSSTSVSVDTQPYMRNEDVEKYEALSSDAPTSLDLDITMIALSERSALTSPKSFDGQYTQLDQLPASRLNPHPRTEVAAEKRNHHSSTQGPELASCTTVSTHSNRSPPSSRPSSLCVLSHDDQKELSESLSLSLDRTTPTGALELQHDEDVESTTEMTSNSNYHCISTVATVLTESSSTSLKTNPRGPQRRAESGKPFIACFFCRGRKIHCLPPSSKKDDQTCG